MKYVQARFIHESLKHPIEIGTVTQSSSFLAEKIAREIQGQNIKNVVEFGAGTGVVTKKILKYLPKDGQLTCFEINKNLCSYLRDIEKRDSRIRVINDSVKNLEKYVDSDELECIISTLPLALMGKGERDKIIEMSSKAKKYVQMQYSPFLLKKLRGNFSDVKLKFTPLNFPFAFIYVCSNTGSNKQ